MKKIAFFFLILIAVSASGQSEFKDVFKSLSENDRFSNMMNLRNYQMMNPYNAIPYFLSAKINDEYMRETNPIWLYDFVALNYNESRVLYGLAKLRLDEQQARRDREYYGEIEILTGKRNVTLPDIINEIDKRLASAEEYFNNAKSVHDNYFKCINKYNECLFKFREILKYYPNYKDLYLLSNDDLINDVKGIAQNFDSSLVFFETYSTSCAKLPHLLKVNNYQLNTIDTYRLEGLIESDFSLPVVQLWDFKTWSDNFLKIVATDIQKIRNGMIETDDLLNKQIDKLKNEEVYADELPFYWPEDKFLNLIGKYDYSSVANDLFNYKKLKINYLVNIRRKINNPTDSINEQLFNRLVYYKDLAFQEKILNEEADLFKSSISIDKVGKYLGFFDTRYRGMDGLIRWYEVDKYSNNEIFKSNLRHLQKFIQLDEQKNDYADSLFLYKKKEIAFGIQKPDFDSIKADTVLTTQLDRFKNKSLFLSGFEIDKKLKMSSFLTKVDENGKVEWFLKPRFPVLDTLEKSFPVFQQLLDDSNCVVLHHFSSRNGLKQQAGNVIIKTNWKGEVVQTLMLKTNDFPRYFFVDEINEQFVVVTKGNNTINDSFSKDTLSISLYDYSGNQLWNKQFLLNGNFVDVVFTNSNLFVTFNFNQFSSLSGESISFASNNPDITNALCLYIKRDGTLKSICQYSLPEGFAVDISKKINSNLINLVGKTQGSNEPLYLLIDSDGIPVYSSNQLLKFKTTDK